MFIGKYIFFDVTVKNTWLAGKHNLPDRHDLHLDGKQERDPDKTVIFEWVYLGVLSDSYLTRLDLLLFVQYSAIVSTTVSSARKQNFGFISSVDKVNWPS